jgi:surface protein
LYITTATNPETETETETTTCKPEQFRFAFGNAKAFNSDISGWRLESVEKMAGIFNQAERFNQNLGCWALHLQNDAIECHLTNEVRTCMEVGNMGGWKVPDLFEDPVRHSIFRANAATLHLPCWYNNTDVECVGPSACPFRFRMEEDLVKAIRMWSNDRDTALEPYGAIEAWDTSRLDNLGGYLFSLAAGPNFNEDVSRWDTGQVTNLALVFYELPGFNQDLSKWDTSKVAVMTSLFDGASSFNQDLNRWQTTAVTLMRALFSKASLFNGNVGDWDTSKVGCADRMFYRASLFNQDLSKWDVSKLTGVERMFHEASSFNSDISAWTPRRFTIMEQFLWLAVEFNQDLSCWAAYFENRTASSFYSAAALEVRPLRHTIFPWHMAAVPCWSKAVARVAPQPQVAPLSR